MLTSEKISTSVVNAKERTAVNYKQLAILFTIATLALFYRRFDQFFHPNFWAEDGLTFFRYAEEMGPRSIITYYGGYLHFVPRIIASIISLLHISYYYVPAAYVFASYLVTLAVIYGLWKCAIALNIHRSMLYAASFLFLPVGGEIYLCLTALNFIVSLYLINYVLVSSSVETPSSWWHTVLLLILALTGPASFLLSPVILLIIVIEWKRMSLKKLVPFAVILLGGLVQALGIFVFDKGFFRGAPGEGEEHHIRRNFTNNSVDIFLPHRLYANYTTERIEILGAIIFICIVLLLVFAYRRIKHPRKYVLPLVAVIYFASFIHSYWPLDSRMLGLNVPRYHFTPYACFAWLTIWGYDRAIKSIHLVAAALIISFNYERMNYNMPNKHWKQQVKDYYQKKRPSVEITPDGWFMFLPEKK